jgi:hypothetical protein
MWSNGLAVAQLHSCLGDRLYPPTGAHLNTPPPELPGGVFAERPIKLGEQSWSRLYQDHPEIGLAQVRVELERLSQEII